MRFLKPHEKSFVFFSRNWSIMRNQAKITESDENHHILSSHLCYALVVRDCLVMFVWGWSLRQISLDVSVFKSCRRTRRHCRISPENSSKSSNLAGFDHRREFDRLLLVDQILKKSWEKDIRYVWLVRGTMVLRILKF